VVHQPADGLALVDEDAHEAFLAGVPQHAGQGFGRCGGFAAALQRQAVQHAQLEQTTLAGLA